MTTSKNLPRTYQALIVETYDDGTHQLVIESGNLDGDKYVPEDRQKTPRWTAKRAADRLQKLAEVLADGLRNL